ncbi:N-methyl-L-tryptophan oxidase [Lentzea aerocolonigenes]|uniref:N-methyl-L-tryptophan oxidase n=1 Tax=Lentzea aerocolonigenes TaxID=68170 RepID=UPI0004C31E47|nr:N-methyl-L-tryptophan oxidase [Lentzea aerocolonigenes]MCP2245990.1 sarcosine oxidase [Lentzea aerocolonigenes]
MASKKRVAVVGTGTVGSQAAWRLAARGAEVVGYDRFAPGHDRGAAGGETRVFRSVQTHDSRYVPLVQHADALWKQLQAETGRELRRLTGALVWGPADDPHMRTVVDGIAEHGLDHEVIDAEAMAKRFPQFRVDDGDLVILDCHAGYIRPELTVQTAARRAEELGARIRRYTPVREVAPVAGGGVEIRTDTGTERFDAAVVTPGPWVGDLLPDLPWEVSICRAISAWFLPHEDPSADAERPAFIRCGEDSFYGIPSPDGLTVKLGLPQTHHQPVDDPNRLNRTVAPEELETFTAVLRRHLPGLNPDPVRVSVFMEGYTHSNLPLVGPVPGCDDVVLLAGFSGQGFKLAPAMGDIAADLVLEGRTSQPIDFVTTHARTVA